MMKFTTGDIARQHKINRQTIHVRILALRLDPVETIGRTRLFSSAQVNKIVNYGAKK